MADGITTADAALWLGVTPEAIYKWRERGLVTPLNPDHKPLRWDPDDLRRVRHSTRRDQTRLATLATQWLTACEDDVRIGPASAVRPKIA